MTAAIAHSVLDDAQELYEFTREPWVYGLRTDIMGERAKITAVAHCGDYVIGLPDIYPGGDYRNAPLGDLEADARLIALAPTLFRLALDILYRNDQGHLPLPIVLAARDAVAKMRPLKKPI